MWNGAKGSKRPLFIKNKNIACSKQKISKRYNGVPPNQYK
jgi:hypothetical protein